MLSLALWCLSAAAALAQGSESDRLVVATVERPPFAMDVGGEGTGFSLDLWERLADELGLQYRLQPYDTFPEMLRAVEEGRANAAVANISISAERETRMDFTQPIFSSGFQVMLPPESSTWDALRAALSPRLLLLVTGAALALLVLGMLMWLFERRHGTFGARPRDAAFPAFWWSLNVLISGDYKEDTPRSPLGRLFGTAMIVASLFVVSLFVANLTANITLNAITDDVARLSDLDGRRVGTTAGSVISDYLDERGVGHRGYDDLAALLEAFEAAELDAVVFDGPVLAWYVQTAPQGSARLVDRVFRRDNYGIALPSGSALREPINRALLRFEENGTHAELMRTWFGAEYADG